MAHNNYYYYYNRKGVNIRHLGLVRSALLKLEGTGRDDVMQLLLREMILRVVKNFMRRQMRQRMVQILYPRDEPFKQIVVGILNLIGTEYSEELFLLTEFCSLCLNNELILCSFGTQPYSRQVRSGSIICILVINHLRWHSPYIRHRLAHAC